ncbi:MAG TPA: MaoC/PaaZ C-terminal domain-containing protein [Conexibacter sp.]|nr:MaoC/PaaZ C-terminal domain-containing protein [Conexibacter sp.]
MTDAATAVPAPPGESRRNDALLLRPFGELRVGETFISKGRTITESDVVQFAALTGDWHPQHSDAVYGEQSIFGARVAHGLLLLSYSVGLVPNQYVVALRRLRRVVFKRPVYFGDTIHVEAEIKELRPFGEEAGLVSGFWRIFNQRGELVCSIEMEALWATQWR